MSKNFKFILLTFLTALLLLRLESASAKPVRFSAVSLQPAGDASDYFTVYGSPSLKQWDAHAGFYLDYSSTPLEFSNAIPAGQRQEIVDQVLSLHAFGSLGLTDWLSVGVNVPVGLYNWFYSDDPQGAPTGDADHGFGMQDLAFFTKFKLLDASVKKVGVAIVPHITVPTGDSARYLGNGGVTGGGKVVVDFVPIEPLSFALNLGTTFRESVVRNQVEVDDMATLGFGANYKITKLWSAIGEVNAWTQWDDLFNDVTTPVDVNAGIRHNFKNTNLLWDLGGTLGFSNGVTSPQWRVFSGLRYTFKDKPKKPQPVVEQRIQENKIITWGKIQYDTNKATIKPESFPILDDVADVMLKNPDVLLVQVEGHTDARGTDAYNLKLSDARANSAMAYLVQKGVAANRLQARGFGESNPIAENTTPQGMEKNRRTEFVIINRAQ